VGTWNTVLHDLEPCEEEEEREPEVGEEREVVVRRRDVEDVRPDHDPQNDLDQNRRQNDHRVPPRQECPQCRGEEHEHDRAPLCSRDLGERQCEDVVHGEKTSHALGELDP
jgi:hypothetical protein